MTAKHLEAGLCILRAGERAIAAGELQPCRRGEQGAVGIREDVDLDLPEPCSGGVLASVM